MQYMYQKLDPELKARWVKALRSGKYKQAHGHLCELSKSHDESYCCLGVLANEELDAEWRLSDEKIRSGRSRYRLYYNGRYVSVFLDGALRPLGISRHAARELARMNDSGKSFSTIARWIEKNL